MPAWRSGWRTGFPYRDSGVDRRFVIKWIVVVSVIVLVLLIGVAVLIAQADKTGCTPAGCSPNTTQPG